MLPAASTVIVLTYINTISKWWPAEAIATDLLVPGFTQPNLYNHVVLSFWTTHGPVDIGLMWANIAKYFGNQSQFGSTNAEIQRNLIQRYHQAGIKVLISAFGSTEQPTTARDDPVETANKLAAFVLSNNLDGADIDWEDGQAMKDGTGAKWLITFTQRLRELLPNKIISHAPQGPYFSENIYKKGGYTTVHNKVGNLIDFYNVQLYNQDTTSYDSFQTLFYKSNGWALQTSVNEMISLWKIPASKIVVGKPAMKAHADNTGYVAGPDLGQWLKDFYQKTGWKTGVMFWKYKSGTGKEDGNNFASEVVTPLLHAIGDKA